MISFKEEQLFLVSGASSGIGRATALLLNRMGASVIALGRNQDRLAEAKEAAHSPQRFHLHSVDLLQEPDIRGLVTSLRKQYGKFSGFCSCAGTMFMDSLNNYDPQKAASVYMLHAQIPLMLTQSLADRRECTGAGTSIVFVAALGGVVVQPGLLSYGGAKAALISEEKCLSKELGKRKIRVNCVSPGLVRTAMTEGAYSSLMGYDVLAAEEANYPLGIGQAEDVASICVFLLSDAAKWISGQNIILDGGCC